MNKYRCKSKIIAGQPCERNCIVQTEFEPRGCLYVGVAEEWEVAPEINLELAVESFGKALENLTPEEIEKHFPPENIPKGWVSIEEHLPAVRVDDFLNNNGIVRVILVKDKNGSEFRVNVGDHNMWYYGAKEAGITHWWNGEITKKQEVLCLLSEAIKITTELLENLEKTHGVIFEVVSIPRFPLPPINEEKIRLFKFEDKIFL